MDHKTFHSLLDRYLQDTISPEELADLKEMLASEEYQPLVRERIAEDYLSGVYAVDPDLTVGKEILAALKAQPSFRTASRRVHRVHFLRTTWFKYAAVLFLVFGIGAYLWLKPSREKTLVSNTQPRASSTDVPPGSNTAVLTLSDGRRIVLDSITNGQIAEQAGTKVVKTADGQIMYSGDGNTAVMNTMTTPRGGQYQLTLPDGSRVWLNAASSITYPTVFSGKERTVTVTGEAYFDVVKNATKPFRVSLPDQSTIEVLGTEFNVNTYPDEPAAATTLVEGSVLVKSGTESQQLRPREQLRINNKNLQLVRNADVSQATAWKKGYFQFNNDGLPVVMRQLSRWYDVDVVYPEGVPSTLFYGKMGRDLSLTQVLKLMGRLNIQFTIQNKQLIVLPVKNQ